MLLIKPMQTASAVIAKLWFHRPLYHLLEAV